MNRLSTCYLTRLQKQSHSILLLSLAMWTADVGIPSTTFAAETTGRTTGKQSPAYVVNQHSKPRVRSVLSSKSLARSGPSDQYYATMTLARGTSVDVYLETSDGWSGIRPPAGSHDWIPASVAYLLPGGMSAEIIESETPAWIGSDASELPEFRWQTSLAKTQQVHVLGEEMQMGEDGKKQLWYRIAPPQGEFRWVKTSQLSDVILPKSRKIERIQPKPSQVQLTSHVEEIANSDETISNPQISPNQKGAGEVVWSDEQEVLAQVDHQIKSEQAEMRSRAIANGVPSNILSQNEGMEPSRKDPTRMDPLRKPRGNTNDKSIKPVPRKQNLEHQMDFARHWDAVQNAEKPKMRVGPVSSVLGLIGISVVEAERAPVYAQIAQSRYANSHQNHIGQAGPVGANRLDRLPRPGQRSNGMTLPTHEINMSAAGPSLSIMTQQSSDSLQSSQMSPYGQGETTFSRWLKSQEPIFGGSQPMGGQMVGVVGSPSAMTGSVAGPTMYSQPTPSPVAPQLASIPADTSAWHGLSPEIRSSHPPQGNRFAQDNSNFESADNQDEFQTPEIQSALVRLTQEIATPTENWNLNPMKAQASQWIENGATVMVRGEARLLMERIERFESLRQRTMGMVQNGSMLTQQMIGNAANNYLNQAGASTGVVTASAQETVSNRAITAVAQSQLREGDASGWLVQVHTSFPGQPEFALTDDQGNVIAYVQPSPGMNLRRYLQQPVTIFGMRGYIPNLASKQILAERIVRMR